LAVSADCEAWYLLNASPDIAAQIESCAPLLPGPGLRETPIRGVLLTDAEIDHVAGLLSLRQGAGIQVYGTQPVLEGLSRFLPLRSILASFGTFHWITVAARQTFELAGGLSVRPIALGGAPPRYVSARASVGDWSVGYRLLDKVTGGVAVYAPGVGEWSESLAMELASVDCVLFDGTFWSETEMADSGVGERQASAMGHVPIGGPAGSAAGLSRLAVRRRIYVHINNTNPILDEASDEHGQIVAAGIEVGHDGMELEV
jgi:pyrroloquinoline quinone biosynthesis protein B